MCITCVRNTEYPCITCICGMRRLYVSKYAVYSVRFLILVCGVVCVVRVCVCVCVYVCVCVCMCIYVLVCVHLLKSVCVPTRFSGFCLHDTIANNFISVCHEGKASILAVSIHCILMLSEPNRIFFNDLSAEQKYGVSNSAY